MTEPARAQSPQSVELNNGTQPEPDTHDVPDSQTTRRPPPRKKSVLSMAAKFEQDSSSPPPAVPTPYKGRKSFSSRSLTDPHISPVLNQGSFDIPNMPSPSTSPNSQRVPIIIPKTFSDMKKAGEPISHVQLDSDDTNRHFKSLKLSRFNEFKEQDSADTNADSDNNNLFDEYNNEPPLSVPQFPNGNSSSSPKSSSHFITRSVSSSSNGASSFLHDVDHNSPPFEDVLQAPFETSTTTTYEAPTNLPSMHNSRPSSASHTSSVSSRAPSVTLKPIIREETQPQDENIIFAVCVVGFHHIRGPEVEFWKGCDGDQSKLWPNLPFQGLPDGSHTHEENFCYFTLLYDQLNHTAPLSIPTRDKAGNIIEEASDMENVTTLFGISCNRQIRASELKDKPADVTRSTVQKSVVVIARKPIFGPIREKLAVITRAYFLQGDFSDMTIIENLYDNLNQLFSTKLDENDMYVGMSLRELIFRLRSKVLILLKALLLEKKIIFFSNNTEVLCASQFSLVSLIPALMDNLEDCGSPLLNKFEKTAKKPTSLRSSDRKSLLAFMGLPLQPFAEGGMFNPYVPLQQFHELKAPETKYFLVGSTNSLLLSPQNKIADIVVHMDHDTVEISNNSLNGPLSLSSSDRKWIDGVVSSVVDTWDPEDPWRPKGLGFHGSEDFVRQQFEDYIMGLMSSVKYDQFLNRFGNQPPKGMSLREVEGNPIKLFNQQWVHEWRTTNNFRIFSKLTDDEIFDIVEPKHMVTSLTFSGLQRKVAQQMNDLHLEERVAPAREAASRVAKAWGTFWWGDQDESTQQQQQNQQHQSNGSNSTEEASKTLRASDDFQDEYLGHDDPKSSPPTTSSSGRGRTNTISTTHSVLSPIKSNTSNNSASQTSTAATMTTSNSSSTTATNGSASASGPGGYFASWPLWGSSRGRALSTASSATGSSSSPTTANASATQVPSTGTSSPNSPNGV